MEQGSISIYIDEVNMHHKIKLRDDPRIDSVIYFEDQLTLVAHLKEGITQKPQNLNSKEDSATDKEEEKGSTMKSSSQNANNFKKTQKSEQDKRGMTNIGEVEKREKDKVNMDRFKKIT